MPVLRDILGISRQIYDFIFQTSLIIAPEQIVHMDTVLTRQKDTDVTVRLGTLEKNAI